MNVSYSNRWTGAFSGPAIVLGDGNISANPQFVDAPTDLSLSNTSVCIDSGTSTGAPAYDYDYAARPINGDGINGDEYDMGALEYGGTPGTGTGGAGGGTGGAGGTGGTGGMPAGGTGLASNHPPFTKR